MHRNISPSNHPHVDLRRSIKIPDLQSSVLTPEPAALIAGEHHGVEDTQELPEEDDAEEIVDDFAWAVPDGGGRGAVAVSWVEEEGAAAGLGGGGGHFWFDGGGEGVFGWCAGCENVGGGLWECGCGYVIFVDGGEGDIGAAMGILCRGDGRGI